VRDVIHKRHHVPAPSRLALLERITNRNLDFARRDHVDVHGLRAPAFRTASPPRRLAPHADATIDSLPIFSSETTSLTPFFLQASNTLRALSSPLVTVNEMSVARVRDHARLWTITIDVQRGVGQRLEDAGRRAGFGRDHQRDLGLVLSSATRESPTPSMLLVSSFTIVPGCRHAGADFEDDANFGTRPERTGITFAPKLANSSISS